MFHGSIVALVTPMKPNGAIDIDKYRELVDWHIENLTDAIVVLGTTGESPTIEFNERQMMIKAAIDQASGRIPIIVGTGVNCTQETIHLTRNAMELGADACLLVTPYYNKPPQEGLYKHFKAVAEAVAIPQILYNVPSRTGCDLLPETIGRLSTVSNIIGIKESTGNVARVHEILEHTEGDLDLLTGDDPTALEFITAGGKGVISVTANVAPRLVHDMCRAALNKDHKTAKQLNEQLMPLNKQLFIESNPIPVKWALHEMAKIDIGIRLPLTPLSESKREIMRDALHLAKII
jgi:4-hydroxy-tetrahydrodipicolinate synthase